MTSARHFATRIAISLSILLAAVIGHAQVTTSADSKTNAASSTTTVPRLIRFSGVARDLNNHPLPGVVGITFSLYAEQTGGAALWLETQNVQTDSSGHYSVLLGATNPDGLPADIFTSAQARWMGVQIEQQAEQARTLLVSAPYALKAGDAETLGGLPASAFMMANGKAADANAKAPSNPDITGVGTVDYIPMWDTTGDIVDSVIYQKSSEIGIGTTAPAATLDVNGKGDVRDTLTLFPKSTDDTLAINGTTFNINSKGEVTFISGQKFPGAGTITGITTASGSGLSGGGTSGTLSLKIPAAGVTNAMLADSKVTLNANTAGGLTTPGAMTLGSTYTIGLKPCSANQILQYSGSEWNCATATGTGTITGITTASGSGLSGGGTSGTLNLSISSAGVTNTMLQHDSLTVTAGTGLSGGGAVALGGTTTLSLNTANVAQLNTANAFSAAQTINGPSSSIGLTVDTAGNASNPQVEIIQNNSSDYARLRFTDSGSNDAWDIAGFTTPEIGNTAQLNFWNSVAQLNVLELTPLGGYVTGRLQVNNATSDGADIYSTAAGAVGVSGSSNSSADYTTGVFGIAGGGALEDIGVWGLSAGIGSYSEGYESSVVGTGYVGFYTIGSWSDTTGNLADDIYGIAALATADNAYSIVGANNSGGFATASFYNYSSDAEAPVMIAAGGVDQCTIYTNGNLTCDGSISPSVPVNSGNQRVALYGVAAAENWFEDAGGGQLSNGSAVINLDGTFAQTVNTGVDYRVFLTPKGDCKGLYVSHETATSFEVHELGGGTSNIAFDYRIMAKRAGFETARLETTKPIQPLKRRPAGSKVTSPDDVLKVRLAKMATLSKARASGSVVPPRSQR